MAAVIISIASMQIQSLATNHSLLALLVLGVVVVIVLIVAAIAMRA